MNEHARALLDRAHGLAAPFQHERGVIGAFVFGSAARPHADAHSDVDVQIVIEPGATVTQAPGRQATGTTRISDLWIIDIDELGRLLETHADINRRRVANAIVLYDTDDRVKALIERAAHVPTDVREARMRVHHIEMTRAAQALQKAEKRGRKASVRLVAAELVVATGNLLFMARHQWPSSLSWMFEELAAAGIPDEIVSGLRDLAATPTAKSARRLRGAVDQFLLASGIGFVKDPEALWAWISNTEEGQLADVTYGGELCRRA